MQLGTKKAEKLQNARSFIDLANRHQLQEDVTDSRTDLKLLEAFLRGDQVKDKLPLTHQALEFFKIENAEFANKLKSSAHAADKARRLVQQKTSQLQRTPGKSRPLLAGASKAEELYQKDFDRRKRIEELRQKLDHPIKERSNSADRSQSREPLPYQSLEAKKQALAQKIMMLQAEKGKSQSNSIVERVFESKYKQEVLITKSGEEVILQSALKERKRRQEPAPADTSLIRKAKLSESRGLSSKSTNVTNSKINKSDLSRSQILDKSSFQRGDSPGSPDKENHSVNKSVTKKKRSGDGRTVYVNYKGEKPPVVPTVTALEQERRRKEEEEAQKRLVQQAAEQKLRQEAEAMALKAQREAEEAERAALEEDNYDLADEKRKLELIQRQRELEWQRARVEESAKRKREKNYLEEFLVSKSKQLPSIDPADPILAKKIAMRAKIEIPDRPVELDPTQEFPKFTKQRIDTRGQPLVNFRHHSPPPSQSSKSRPAAIPKHLAGSKLSEDTNEIENGFRRYLGVPELGRVEPQYERFRFQPDEDYQPEEPTELNSEEKEEKRIEEALMKPSLAPVSINPFKTRDAQLKPPVKPATQKPIATIKAKTPVAPVPVPPLEMEGRISVAGGGLHQGKSVSRPQASNQDKPGLNSKKGIPQSVVNPSKDYSPEENSKKASAPDFSMEDPAMFDDDEESSEWKGINPYDLAHRSPRKSEVEITSQADHSEFKIKKISKQRTIGGDEPIEETVKTPRKLPEDLQCKTSSHNLRPPQMGTSRPAPEEAIQKHSESRSEAKKALMGPATNEASDKMKQVQTSSQAEPNSIPHARIPAHSSKVESSAKGKSVNTPPPLESTKLMETEAFEKYSYRQPKQAPLEQAQPQPDVPPELPAEQQPVRVEETQ